MWIKSNFFKYSVGILLTLIIIFFVGQIDFFLQPFKKFLAIVFFPILISGLLYYLFRPLVRLGRKIRFPAVLSILVVFLIFFVIITLIGVYAGSLIIGQFQQLVGNLPQITQSARDTMTDLISRDRFFHLSTKKVEEQLTSYGQKMIPALSSSLFSAISTITSIASVLIVVPFILFYLLKDDRKFFSKGIGMVPEKYRAQVADILEETDKTLSAYIIGQVIIASILGVFTYISYLIIGLQYAFTLAFFVLITSFIPMFGGVIGVIPGFFVGLAFNPLTGVKVLLVTIFIQQVVWNLVSPNIIGKRLDIHPLTVIFIFLGAASLYGLIGMLIAVPTYAVLKVVAGGAIKIYKIWRHQDSYVK